MSEAKSPVSVADAHIANVPTSSIIPPWSMIVIGVISVQIGAAVAKQLFDTVGPSGVVFLRTSLAAILFWALWRPRLRGYSKQTYVVTTLYGVVIALNMLVFYAAIERVPLGITVAIAFAGPLGIAVWNSRKVLDFVWIALAAIGILLLSPLTGVHVDALGMGLALLTAVMWAIYLVVTKRASHALPGNAVLAIAMLIAALVALPFGGSGAAKVLPDVHLIILSLVVALLSSAIPLGLEFHASRRMSSYAFGLLFSLEPVIAAIVGFVMLGEALDFRQVLGIGLVTVAAAATARWSA